MQLSSLQGSILENRILEDDFQVDSISTAKVFQLANDNQVPIATIDADNVESTLPVLPFAEAIKEDIANAVNQNQVVKVPQAEISYQNWTGIGYIKDDPETGSSGWMLSGTIAGGMTAGTWSEDLLAIFGKPYSKRSNKDPASARNIFRIADTDMQSGKVGEPLSKPLQVMVLDIKGHPVQGAEVTFSVKAGGGSFTSAMPVYSNARGVASAEFILGEKTEDNPTYVKQTGDTHYTRIGENIVDALLASGTSLKKPFTAYGYPKTPKQMRMLHGDLKTGTILSFAGFVSVSVEDEYGNPISNIPVEFEALPATPVLWCSNPNRDLRNLAQLIDRNDICTEIKISPIYGECESGYFWREEITNSHGVASAHIILGGVPGAEYPIKATYNELNQTFHRISHPFDHLGTCNDKNKPPKMEVNLKYVYAADDYGQLIDGVKAGEEVPVKARLVGLGESSEIIDELITCIFTDPIDQTPIVEKVFCPLAIGTRTYYTSTDFSQATVTFSGKPGTPVGEGVYEGKYKVMSGQNAIAIEGIAKGTVTKYFYDCGNSPICGSEDQEVTLNDSTIAYIYGVEIQAGLEPESEILVDGEGYTIKNYDITSDIIPSEYTAQSAYVVIKENSTPIQYIETDPKGKSKVTLLKGYWFDTTSDYTAQVVLNIGRMHEGRNLEIRSDEIQLPLKTVYDELLLRPVIVPMLALPGSDQLKVYLRTANDSSTKDVTSHKDTVYEWIGNGLENDIDGITDVINKIRNILKSSDFGLIDENDIHIDSNGKLTVNRPGIQIVRAVYMGKLKSDYSIILAGLKLKKISLIPESIIEGLVDYIDDILGPELNTPLILAPDGNSYILDKGFILVGDMVFEFLGKGTIGMNDLIEAIEPFIQKSLLAVSGGGAGLAAAFAALLEKGVEFGVTQFLDSIESSDRTIATVSNGIIKGFVQAKKPGLTDITGTLKLGRFGEASDTVLTWVLPNLESASLNPSVTAISITDSPVPGPTVRTMARVKALESAPIAMPESFKSFAEFLDQFLPGGLKEWYSGTIDKVFTLGDYKFHIKGSITTTSKTITFSNIQIEFIVPNEKLGISNDYIIWSPDIAKQGQRKKFETHIVHQDKAGESAIVAQVSIIGLGSAEAHGVIIVSDKEPVAHDDAYSVDEDNNLDVFPAGVLANDTDPNGDPLVATLVRSVSSGMLIFRNDGSFDYSSIQDFNGTDTFTYIATDGKYNSNMATVTITVNPVNDPPVANNDAYNVDKNDTLDVLIPGVLSNDTDVDGDPLTAILINPVSSGSLAFNSDGSFSYTPNLGFEGHDTFTYEASDGTDNSNTATVTISVANHPPVANNDAYSVDKNDTLDVLIPGVLSNDTDVDGDPLTAVLINSVSSGSLAFNSDGSFTYTPNLGFEGTITFTYEASDGKGNSNTATVTISVNPYLPTLPRVLINEVVVDPKQDWNDSGGDGDGIPFNDKPGSSIAPSTNVTTSDQWVEVTNIGAPVDLTGWTLTFVGSGGTVETVLLGTTILAPGQYLVLGHPGGVVMPVDTKLSIQDPAGLDMDQIDLGVIRGLVGPATGVNNEALARIPDGIDTDQPSDFGRRTSSIGSTNQV
jgi:hypothetical protein